jgi:hypothetical protein
MFYELKHHFRLRALQAKRRAILAEARAGVWDALPHGAVGAGAINRAIDEGQSKLSHIDDEITRLLSDRLLEQAQKYLVFWPEDSDGDNRIPNALGERKLSADQITELRAQIRKERKERWGALADAPHAPHRIYGHPDRARRPSGKKVNMC